MTAKEKFLLLRDLLKVKISFPSSSQRSGTLVVRLDRIGDFALYAPFAAAGQKEGEKTYFLVNELWAELCRKLFPEAKIISLSPGRFMQDALYRNALLKQIAALKVRKVLQSRFYRELFVEEMITLAAAPEETFCFEVTPFHLHAPLLKLFSSRNKIETAYLPGEHELQRNIRFAKKCDPSFRIANPWQNKPFPAPERFRDKEYVCVFPGSGKGSYCCWQQEKWSELLSRFPDTLFVLCGTPAEKDQLEQIARTLPEKRCMIAADLSLEEFAGVVSHAQAALGNDTGGIHLAAMSGVPALAISGRGQPGWFLPYPADDLPPGVIAPAVATVPQPCENCFWRCTKLHKGICKCIDEITVSHVLEVLEKSNFSALR